MDYQLLLSSFSHYFNDLTLKNGLIAIVILFSTKVMFSAVKSHYKLNEAKKRIEKRRLLRDHQIASIPNYNLSEFVSEDIARVLAKSTAEEILELIKTRKVTSEQVLRYFVKVTLHLQPLYNAVTQIFFDDALKRAKELDKILQETGKTVGPLHGLPVSIKENFDMKGTDATLGFGSRINLIAEKDAVLIEVWKKAGAIPFVKTNVPQTLLLPESSNPIFGTTKNPWNPLRTPGGSSGGEAALIASGGSPLGLGSDIGGSIRIPCHFSGIVGFKTTFPRLSTIGGNSGARGQESIRGVGGPMARSVKDLVLGLRVWWSDYQFDLDPSVPPMTFNDEQYNSKKRLRIGFYTTDNFFQPSPACVRAVTETVEKLKGLEHELVYFEPPNVPEAIRIYYGLITADGTQTILNQLENDVLEPAVKVLKRNASAPRFLLTLVATIADKILGWKRMAPILHTLGVKPVVRVWELQMLKKIYTENFTKQMQDQKIDVLIAPAHSLPALLHSSSQDLTPSCSYLMIYNFLNFSAGVVPVTTVKPEDLTVKRKPFDLLERKAALIDEGSLGLPIGVQVISYPFRDEVALRVMREIEEVSPFQEAEKLRSAALSHLYK